MALAVTTSPAHADGALASSSAVTSSFNVPAGGMLVAAIVSNSSTSGTTTATVSGGGLTWTQRVVANFATAGNGYSAIFTAPCPAGATGITVTVTTAGSTSTTRRPSIDVYVATGADLGNPVASSGVGSSATNAPAFSPSITVTGSMQFIAACEWQKLGVPVTSIGFDTVRNFDQTTSPGVSGTTGYKLNGSSGGTSGYTLDAFGTSAAAWDVSRLELRPATAPTVDAGADATVANGGTFNRTATETSDGGQAISARAWTVVSGPASVGSTLGTAAALSWSPSTVGTYVLRYTATNSIGNGTDDVQVIYNPPAPTCNAGADASPAVGSTFTRTATETLNGGTATARTWTVVSGPTDVGSTIGTAAALSWAVPALGTYVLRYSVTTAGGTGTDDITVLSVSPSSIPPTGVPLLPATVNGKIAVEIAWGSSPENDPAYMIWTEVTTDVRIDEGINIKIGRGDEASRAQPASCKLKVANTTGKYSRGGLSPNYPNVRKGTPLRVQMDVNDGNGFEVIFYGYIDTFSPDWNLKGNDATVAINASGALRRLNQRSSPVRSPMRRFYETSYELDTVAYWPAEEGSKATTLKPVIGNQDMDINFQTALPELSSFSTFTTTYPIPKLNGSSWRGIIDPKPAPTGKIVLSSLINIPSTGGTDQTDLMSVWTDGDVELWAVRYKVTGDLQVVGYSGGVLVVNLTILFDWDGKFGQLQLDLTQNGADIDWKLVAIPHPGYNAGFQSGTIASKDLGSPTMVDINWNGGNDNISMGHIAVMTNPALDYTFLSSDVLRAYTGEYVNWTTDPLEGRLPRLAAENGTTVTYTPIVESSTYPGNRLGPQPLGTFLELMYDAVDVNGGVLHDGRDAGLSFAPRRTFENQTDQITIDASLYRLATPFDMMDDDQPIVNKVTITQKTGSSVTAEDKFGPLGSMIIGVYEDSKTLNYYSDPAPTDRAGWELMQGTLEGYRVPTVTIDLTATPALAPKLNIRYIGTRINITKLRNVLTGAPSENIALTVEGYSWKITPQRVLWTANCSNNDRYNVAELGTSTGSGDTEYVARLDTDVSALASAASLGATSLSVTTYDGPIWTTTATRPNDFPFDVLVDGIRVTVTGISGTGTTQTFTVTGSTVTKALPLDSLVELADPTYIGI